MNETTFCSKVASYCDEIFPSLGGRTTFHQATVEDSGSTAGRNRRKDLRFADLHGRALLTGEVKMPGGPSPFADALVKDASDKADHAGAKYFFTWDVNTFVLWDRSLWEKPLLERRVKVWPLRMNLADAGEVGRPETLEAIRRKFLPDLIADLSDILTGVRRDWSLPPDEVFLRSLESHLDWPVALLRHHLHRRADADKSFDRRLQDWLASQDRPFLRNRPDEWRAAVDNAARTLAYVWTNRLIFYKALRARFAELPRLELAPPIKTAAGALRRIDELFREAARVSGDYETLLFPDTHEWANDLPFAPDCAVDAWRAFLRGIEQVDFRDVPADVVGLIFQKLVSPEERHRLGQHFTGPGPVDLINGFCIRSPDAAVLDPACGSGSFLVRAYYRKRAMTSAPENARPHAAVLRDLYGCDVALYPAHLATLNLAAREINGEANYPRIARDDFFDKRPGTPFCELPAAPGEPRRPVLLPPLDAVVGNPPYVRQEKIPKPAKADYAAAVAASPGGFVPSGRSDLHCYFWPHAARWLKPGGHFGFLTSGQWLDVDYGFRLQRWILRRFTVVAVMESAVERWFVDARVKTCITILRRCDDEQQRRANVVKFVRFEQPLDALIGVASTGGVGPEAEAAERHRQAAVDRLRDEIEAVARPVHDDRWRILLKPQGDLWDDGVRAGRAVGNAPAEEADEASEDESDAAPDAPDAADAAAQLTLAAEPGDYVAGKWGRYLRAPDLYFEVLRDRGDRFAPLGDLAAIRRGITSGCDKFFMPTDATAEALEQHPAADEFRRAFGVDRAAVAAGGVAIIRDGADTRHAVERRHLRPEVHSLMKVDRPVVRAADLDRLVLLVAGPLSAHAGTLAAKYVRYGEQATYASKKSRPVPVPERSTCAGRDPWYDLTKLIDPGLAFWPKAQQYRHIIPANPHGIVGNCNLYDLAAPDLTGREQQALVAILNSTLIGLFKTFYGRYAGTEGNLKTEVVDVKLIDVPDPRGIGAAVAKKLADALASMQRRDVGHLVEEGLRDCHSYDRATAIAARPVELSAELRMPDRRALDEATFELLGVAGAAERRSLVDRLHHEAAAHFRAVRVTEIQKMQDRRATAGGGPRHTTADMAADVWDALDLEDLMPLADWVRERARGKPSVEREIPDARPARLVEGGMFDTETVYFGPRGEAHVTLPSRGSAELLRRMAELGVGGAATLPSENAAAMRLLDALDRRRATAESRLSELAASRAPTEEARADLLALLRRWYVRGKP